MFRIKIPRELDRNVKKKKKRELIPELGRSDMVLRRSVAPVGSGTGWGSGRTESPCINSGKLVAARLG